jgi:cell division protein FtsL
MTIPRAATLLVVFALVALIVVHLRAEQTRADARIHELAMTCWRLRQNSWELQLEIARLKTPEQIRERVERWQLNVMTPSPGPGWRVDSGLADAD